MCLPSNNNVIFSIFSNSLVFLRVISYFQVLGGIETLPTKKKRLAARLRQPKKEVGSEIAPPKKRGWQRNAANQKKRLAEKRCQPKKEVGSEIAPPKKRGWQRNCAT